MRYATRIACAALIGFWAADLSAQESTAEPQTSVDERVDEQTGKRDARELDELLGIGEPFFAGFANGQPLDFQQREKLLGLLERMRRMGSRGLAKFRKPARTVGVIGRDPDEFRGEVIALPGFTTYVEREELPPELREKFQVDAWYRCRVITYMATELTIYTLSVPEAWPLSTPTRQYSRWLAMFVKVLPPSVEATKGEQVKIGASFLCVAPRAAWYPGNLLGRLGMDFALFDDVRDRGPLEEARCFYHMLAAVSRAENGRIERAASRQMAERRNLLERMARNPHQYSKDRAAANRALERAEENCDDVIPLFNDPAAQRGKLFVLSGEALRAIEIRVDEPDIVERFGIDHYYEIEMITADSQNNPIVFCVAELPPDMPLGESIHQSVRVAGFFLKSWAFDSRKSADAGEQKRQQLAPLLIAKSVRVLKTPTARPPNMLLAACLAVLAVLGAAVIWYVRRGDRRALAMAAGNNTSLPTRIALDRSSDASDASTPNDA